MTAFNTKRQRTIPDVCRAAQSSRVIPNSTGIDYVSVGTGVITPGNVNVGAICFDLQYAPLGGQQRNTIAATQAIPLNYIPGTMLCLGRQIEVVAQCNNSAGQILFKICDFEPTVQSVAQILANSFTDEDRPPVAVTASATSAKCVTYTCLARFCIVQLQNVGAVNTDYYLSVVARQ